MKHLSTQRFDRAVRLEMLRTRAAIERENFAAHVEQLSVQASPMHFLASLFQFRRKSWVRNTADFLAHYPLILSTLSSVLMGRSSGAARGAGLMLTLLQALASQQKKGACSDK